MISSAAPSQHSPSRTVISIGENDNEEVVLYRQHSPQSSETSNEKMFQRNMMLARDDFQETPAVSAFASTESNENLRRFITKINILPSVTSRPSRKNVSIMSINQDASLLMKNFDGNLSDDQKLVLNISTEKRENQKIEVENVNRILLSGQCSPCDSGTCSDAEANQPPPIPPKGVRMNYLRHHMLSDSFCSDSSASSSDSMQYTQSHLLSPELIRSIDSHHKSNTDSLPKTLLMDIRSHAMIKDESSSDEEHEHDRVRDYSDLVLCNNEPKVLVNFYEQDKSYKFHMNEHLSSEFDACSLATHDESDENFAGYKDLSSRTSTIRSAKGTIRGVKNRVKNGIATFLQMQQTTVKNYKEKDGGKIVLYLTSMGVVRSTYAKCQTVKKILKTLMVKFEERDVFMSHVHQQEIRDRMQSDEIDVPQLFVDGQYIGNADQVERLNELGELRIMLKPFKCMDSTQTCQICGGYNMLPCPSCGGSKKSIHRNHFTAEFIALKCMNCDEVGLVRCYNCS